VSLARRISDLALALVTLGACASTASTSASAPAPAPAPARAASCVASANSTLPSACDILDRFANAIGGREALAKHSSMHETGVMEFVGAGIKADMNIYQAKPNRMVTRMTVPGMGEIARGFDGTTGWQMEPTSGPMLLTGKQLDQMKVEADFMGMMHDPKSFTSAQTTGLVDFNGKPAYELKLVRAGGDTATEYYDPQSGLQVGLVRTVESAMGRLAVTGVVGDYKPFGGLMLPTRMTQKLPTGQQMTVTLNAVEFDAVPANTFELPAPIKALAPPASAPTKP
jgi:hypothetical protein